MRNFTLIIKIAIFTSCLCAGFVKAGAQCNSEFGYTVTTRQLQAEVSVQAFDSTGNKNNQWFADGIFVGAGPSTSFYFYQPGNHTVTHIISDSLHGCFDSTSHIINISFGNACKTSFYANTEDSIILSSCILYANPTVYGGSITNYIWSINGKVMDSANNSTYTLTQKGANYTCLTITTDSGCTAQYCTWSWVVPKCDIPVSFSYTVDSLNPATVTFNAQFDTSLILYRWRINGQYYNHDKTVSLSNYSPGTYPVSLFILDSARYCYDSTAGTFTVPPSACDTFSLAFKYNYAAGDSSTIYFTPQSNQPLTTQSWIIRSIYDSTMILTLATVTPSYTFTDTAHYVVCITAQSANGCSNSYCDIIYAGSKHGGKPAKALTSSPNPVTNAVSITVPLLTPGKISINVYNSMGHRVSTLQKQGVGGNNQITIPAWQLQPGQYFIEIICGNERKRSVFQKL